MWIPPEFAWIEGPLRCANFSSMEESGGSPEGWVTIWHDRLELAARRRRIVPRERVLRVRQLEFRHPAHRLLLRLPHARGLHAINIMVSHPPGAEYSGDIHYVLGFRHPGVTEALTMFAWFGYPVDWTPRVLRSYPYMADLSMDRVTRNPMT